MAANTLLPEFERVLEPHYVQAYNAHVVGRTLEHQSTIEEVRRNPGKFRSPFGVPSESGFEDRCDERDFTVEVGSGENVTIRVYRPKDKSEDELPFHLNFHGGGWTVGTIGADSFWCRRLAVEANAAVFDVGYRLAPENKFPTAIEDSWTVLRHILQNAGRLRIDAKRISLGGVSAGANIAAVLTNRCILKTDIRPLYLSLCVPAVDASILTNNFELAPGKYTHLRHELKRLTAGTDCPYESWRKNYHGPFLSFARMSWFYKHYLPEKPARELLTSPELSPLFSVRDQHFPANLHPPTFLCTAEVDVLCSEGESYAKALSDKGVPTVHKAYDGVPHNFSRQTALLEQARQYQSNSIAHLAAALNAVSVTNGK